MSTLPQDRSFSTPQEHGDGVWSLRVPIPDNPLGYTLIYVLRTNTGVLLIDAGWDCDEAWEALETGLAHCGYLMSDVQATLITHAHPDHIGLALRVRNASGCRVFMGEDERVDEACYGGDALHERLLFLKSQGVPDREIEDFSASIVSAPFPPQHWKADTMVMDGLSIVVDGAELTAIATPGHTNGHMCYLDRTRKFLFTGDHLLTTITPNISTFLLDGSDPLGDYLSSIAKIDCYDVARVMPGHQTPFSEFNERTRIASLHHETRLRELENIVRITQGASTWQLCELVPWSKPLSHFAPFMRYSALGETLAHLVHLRELNRVEYLGHGTWSASEPLES